MIEIKKISEYEWEIPKHKEMKVPVRVFASEILLSDKQKVFKILIF